MSVKVMGQVWELDLPHQEVLVLLAMADHADHEGRHVRPSLELLAWKTHYSKRQVIRILQGLEQRRLIRVHRAGGGRGRATEYTLQLENGVRKSPFRKSDIVSTFSEDSPVSTPTCEEKSDIVKGDRVTSFSTNSDTLTLFTEVTTEKTVTSVTQNSDIAMSPQPSLEPSVNLNQDLNPPPISPKGEGEGERDEQTAEKVQVTKAPKKKASTQPNTAYTTGFEEWWTTYPSDRRREKVDAFATWSRRGLESRTAELVAKLQRLWEVEWQYKESRYIPLPTTYLNKSRYEDEFAAPPTRFASVSRNGTSGFAEGMGPKDWNFGEETTHGQK